MTSSDLSESSRDLYTILQVSKEASPEVIQASYRALIKIHHPQAGGDAEVTKQLNEAYEILMDPVRRTQYDKQCYAARGILTVADQVIRPMPIKPSLVSSSNGIWVIDYSGNLYHISGVQVCKVSNSYGYFLRAYLTSGQHVTLEIPNGDCSWHDNEEAMRRAERKIIAFLHQRQQDDEILDLRSLPYVNMLEDFYLSDKLRKVRRVLFSSRDNAAELKEVIVQGMEPCSLYTVYGDKEIIVPSKEALFSNLNRYVGDRVAVQQEYSSDGREQYDFIIRDQIAHADVQRRIVVRVDE